jgi:DNA-binding beta-propeller fold protein YncE
LSDLAMRPDGKFVYVLDGQTGDLTIVDTVGARQLGRLPLAESPGTPQSAGGPIIGFSSSGVRSNRMAIRPIGGPRPLIVLREGGLLGLRTPLGLAFIDMGTNRRVDELTFPGQHSAVALSPEGKRLFVLSAGRVSFLDGRTGRFLAAATEFEDPAQIVFSGSDAAARCEAP